MHRAAVSLLICLAVVSPGGWAGDTGCQCVAGADGNWVCAQRGEADAATDHPPTSSGAPAAQPAPAPRAQALAAVASPAACVLPGRHARATRKTPPSMQVPADAPLTIEADNADYQVGKGVVELHGNVVARRASQQVKGDFLHYDSKRQLLRARGGVEFRTPRRTIHAARAELHLAENRGVLDEVGYQLPAAHARGTARVARILDREHSTYDRPTYTTCPPGRHDWVLSADELAIDQHKGVGEAKNARLRFKGVPILYLPWASFPIDDRRKSGFLLPRAGYSSKNGVDIQVPYYFNLAPDYDLTLTPRLVSKRGLLLAAEFRYLSRRQRGTLNAEYLPNDRLYDGDNSNRGALSWRHRLSLSPRLTGDIGFDWASDADYLDDLSNRLAIASTRHLQRIATLNYQGDGWRLLGRVQDFQTLDLAIPPDQRPYARLPQLLFQLRRPNQWLGSTVQLDAEYVYFSRTDSVRGSRVDLHPAISLPLRNSWGFVTPKLGARYTAYSLDNNAPGRPDTPSRTSASASLDSGLFLERKSRWFGHAVTQTLEPRLFYLYRTRVDQRELPVFDTDDIDFSFVSLFYEDRFSGADRVGDANQLTAALTSRVIDTASGRELARGSIGQIYYFSDREVQLPGQPTATEATSSLVAEGRAALTPNWDLAGTIQWNPSLGDGRTEKSALRIGYHDESGRLADLAYHFTRDISENTAVSMVWPLNPRLRLIGRLDYSMLFEKTMESVAGFEYGNCCWSLRMVVRNYLSDPSAESNLTFLMQLELRGLGRLGNDIDNYLQRNIQGYRTTYE